MGTQLVVVASNPLAASPWDCPPNPSTRAYALYRKLGWQDCGITNGQLIMRRQQPSPETNSPRP